MSKKSFRIGGPVGVGRVCDVVGDRVGGLGGFDVGVKLLDVHVGDDLVNGDVERGRLKDDANCSLVKTGRKLCGFTVA